MTRDELAERVLPFESPSLTLDPDFPDCETAETWDLAESSPLWVVELLAGLTLDPSLAPRPVFLSLTPLASEPPRELLGESSDVGLELADNRLVRVAGFCADVRFLAASSELEDWALGGFWRTGLLSGCRLESPGVWVLGFDRPRCGTLERLDAEACGFFEAASAGLAFEVPNRRVEDGFCARELVDWDFTGFFRPRLFSGCRLERAIDDEILEFLMLEALLLLALSTFLGVVLFKIAILGLGVALLVKFLLEVTDKPFKFC